MSGSNLLALLDDASDPAGSVAADAEVAKESRGAQGASSRGVSETPLRGVCAIWRRFEGLERLSRSSGQAASAARALYAMDMRSPHV